MEKILAFLSSLLCLLDYVYSYHIEGHIEALLYSEIYAKER